MQHPTTVAHRLEVQNWHAPHWLLDVQHPGMETHEFPLHCWQVGQWESVKHSRQDPANWLPRSQYGHGATQGTSRGVQRSPHPGVGQQIPSVGQLGHTGPHWDAEVQGLLHGRPC